MCLFTCSWFWVIPLPVSDPSLLPLTVASVVQWFTILDHGVLDTLFCLGSLSGLSRCVCSVFFRKTFTHNKGKCLYLRKAIFPHSGDKLTTIFFKVMCFSLWMHIEGTGSASRAVAGGCELPSVHGGNWAPVPCNSSEHSSTEPSPQPPNWVFILSILNAVFSFALWI